MPLGKARFRSAAEGEAPGRSYGGRIIAQALAAAAQTIDPTFVPHSAHAQFLRGGDMRQPTDYVVETLRDGRTIAARAVRVSQDDRLLTVVLISFARERPGLAHQPTMPEVPPPETLVDHVAHRESLRASDPLLQQALWRREHPFEIRPVDFPAVAADRPGPLTYWFRPRPEINSDTPAARAALVAYMSDRFMMTASLMPHLSRLADSEFILASLDHAIWMHRDHAPGDWLLYRVEARTLAGSRAFIRGEMFDAAGRHIASVGQEGVVTTRSRQPGPSDES